jgi:hypothetical protein
MLRDWMSKHRGLGEEAAIQCWRAMFRGVDEWKHVDGVHLQTAFRAAKSAAKGAGMESGGSAGRGSGDVAESRGRGGRRGHGARGSGGAARAYTAGAEGRRRGGRQGRGGPGAGAVVQDANDILEDWDSCAAAFTILLGAEVLDTEAVEACYQGLGQLARKDKSKNSEMSRLHKEYVDRLRAVGGG